MRGSARTNVILSCPNKLNKHYEKEVSRGLHAGEDELTGCQCTVSKRFHNRKQAIRKYYTECVHLVIHLAFSHHSLKVATTNFQWDVYNLELLNLCFNDMRMQAQQGLQANT